MILHRAVLVPVAPALLATLLPLPATSAPPRVEGEIAARLSITIPRDDAASALAPGPFAVFPDGRIAVYIAESEGILLLESDRILHHFPLNYVDRGLHDMTVEGTLLVAGRRPRGGAIHVDLFVFDVTTGRLLQRVQSANPYFRARDPGTDAWRVVVEGDLVGAFEPHTAATYPLWDRATGPVAGAEQVVRATSGLGFGARGVWIPQPDGSLARKVRGRSEPFTGAEEGEFVGATEDGIVVLLQVDRAARGQGLLPRELVVHVLEGEHAISELRLPAVSDEVGAEPRAFSGRPVQVHGGRLYWAHLGFDTLEIRATPLPRHSGG